MLRSYTTQAYGAGSCGELGDSFLAIDSDYFDDISDEIYEKYIKDLRHFKDSSVGLNVTDKPIGDLLQMFWQNSSDACPLECGEAEKQEAGFREWVKSVSWIL